MDKLKKVFNVLRQLVEVWIPICSLIIMFTVFVVEVFARYFFRNPLPWAYEVTVSCYLWLVVLGACYAQRKHAHVTFTLVYDKLGIKGKAICAFLGNLLIAIAFAVQIVPAIKFVDFMKMQKTSVLQIGLNIVYAPFIPFLIIILIYTLMDLYNEFMVFTGLGGQAAIDKMLADTKNETEEAIELAFELEKEMEENKA